MEPKDFSRLAKELVGKRHEAALRTAVSRAYYAALNHAARVAEKSGVKLPEGPRIHEVVADSLVDIEAGLRDQLEYLKLKRGKADYRVWDPWIVDNVTDILEVADYIIMRIDEKYGT